MEENHYIQSPLDTITNDGSFEFRDSRSQYIDNFVYYKALKELNDVLSILLHVSPNLDEEKIIELYEKILKLISKND